MDYRSIFYSHRESSSTQNHPNWAYHFILLITSSVGPLTGASEHFFIKGTAKVKEGLSIKTFTSTRIYPFFTIVLTALSIASLTGSLLSRA